MFNSVFFQLFRVYFNTNLTGTYSYSKSHDQDGVVGIEEPSIQSNRRVVGMEEWSFRVLDES